MKRILEITDERERKKRNKLTLLGKYGFDGTKVPEYMLRSKNQNLNYENLFCSAFVPLRLYETDSKKVIWENEYPSSNRSCRLFRMQFVKENKEVTLKESEDIKKQLEKMKELKINGYKISCNFILSMIDGKVLNLMLIKLIFNKFQK